MNSYKHSLKEAGGLPRRALLNYCHETVLMRKRQQKAKY